MKFVYFMSSYGVCCFHKPLWSLSISEAIGFVYFKSHEIGSHSNPTNGFFPAAPLDGVSGRFPQDLAKKKPFFATFITTLGTFHCTGWFIRIIAVTMACKKSPYNLICQKWLAPQHRLLAFDRCSILPWNTYQWNRWIPPTPCCLVVVVAILVVLVVVLTHPRLQTLINARKSTGFPWNWN